MLVVLSGLGRGLQTKILSDFADDAVNSIWIYSGKRSLPFQGHTAGSTITFDNDDMEALGALPKLEALTGRFQGWSSSVVKAAGKYASFSVRSVHPDHQVLENTIISDGRFLHDADIENRTKVAVIGKPVATFFFGKKSPLGKWLQIRNTFFRVVGVFDDDGRERERRMIYLPISTIQSLSGGTSHIHQWMFTIKDPTTASSKTAEDISRQLLARRHNFAPSDRSAIRIRNNVEDFAEFQSLFQMIQAFISIVAAGTILAGLMGVSNIMLISVRERTKEIGLRKAIGAPASSIVRMIATESIVVTTVAGYGGLLLGVVVLELIKVLAKDNEYLTDPRIDTKLAVITLLLLVAAGTLAGYFPARKAAKIEPVDALRDEV